MIIIKISTKAKNLLITILRNTVYSVDQSANITDLETELLSGGSPDQPESGIVPNTKIANVNYLSDGLHLGENGYTVLGNLLASEVKYLLCI